MKILFGIFLSLVVIAAFTSGLKGEWTGKGSYPPTVPGRLPVGSPVTTFSEHQTALGTYYSFITVFGGNVYPSTIIIDPKVGFLLNTTAPAGIQWTLKNGTYLQVGDACYYSFFGTYENQLDVFSDVVKLDEYGVLDRYVGWGNDFGGCGHGFGFQMLVNSLDNTLQQFAFTSFVPLPLVIPGIPYPYSGNQVTNVSLPGVGTVPPLSEVCWSLNVSDPTTNYCYNYHFGFPCSGFGDYPCMANPGPYIPE